MNEETRPVNSALLRPDLPEFTPEGDKAVCWCHRHPQIEGFKSIEALTQHIHQVHK